MDYLLPLAMLGLGVVLILVFTPLAWRKTREQPPEQVATFEQVLEQDLLASQIQALEDQIRLLKDEYRQLKKEEQPVVEMGEKPATQAAQVKLPDLELYRAVFQAYDAGKSVAEIAKELGRGKGEIQLILNLRR